MSLRKVLTELMANAERNGGSVLLTTADLWNLLAANPAVPAGIADDPTTNAAYVAYRAHLESGGVEYEAVRAALEAAHPVEPVCQGDGVCTNPRCPRHGIEWMNVENRCICPDPLDGRHDLACMIHGRRAAETW